MPGDYTRFTFDALKNRIGVLMQQGRVMLDADFNELVEILKRRMQVADLDTLGPCVVPRETPNGFEITIPSSGQIAIGPGRAYVNGILAENFGELPEEWDPHLAEERGTTPVLFTEQPYHPGATLPEGDGPFLAYLDVWQREVTHLEDPDILEKAVGVDTATRLQTVWQVRTLDLSNAPDATCTGDIPGWDAETAPSAGRLTTEPVGVPQDTDPCAVSPTGGFRGTENRLYRVEVHDPGAIGTATFTWSRDNASVAARVREINATRDEIRVSRTARDDVLRFSPNDWVEVTDDHLELTQQPGVMRRVLGVDDVTETITLDSILPAGVFDATDAARLTRVRKWDQKGQVLNGTGTVVADVEASGGVIPISGAAEYVLEDGVQVTFSTVVDGGEFHVGDYWVFEARTVDASIQELDEEPPRGIHHHYCRLAIVTFPAQIDECRTFWPPEAGGGGCDCTQCVSAESHNSGAFTIQMAVNRAASTGGKVCLGPGLFGLTEPIRISGALSFQLEGHGWMTSLWYGGEESAAIRVTGSIGVDISRISVFTASSGDVGRIPVMVRNSFMVGVERCMLVHFALDSRAPCIALNGALGELRIRNNVMFGPQGVDTVIRDADTPNDPNEPLNLFVSTIGAFIDDNLIWGTYRGIGLNGQCFHLGDTRVSGNTLLGGFDSGIRATGYVMPVSRVDIARNEVATRGHGVVVGEDNVRVTDNDISAFGDPDPSMDVLPTGVWITNDDVLVPIQRCAVIGNRIVGMSGDGILIDTAVGSAMIKSNIIDGVGRNGINMAGEAAADVLSIENNHVLDACTTTAQGMDVAAIRAISVRQGEIASNTVRDFASAAVQSGRRAGIEVGAARSIRIADNDVEGVGPLDGFVGTSAGIVVVGPYSRVDVLDNSVLRSTGVQPAAEASQWFGLVITQGQSGGRLSGSYIDTMGDVAIVGASGGARSARHSGGARRVPEYLEDNEIVAAAYDNYGIVSDYGITILPRGHPLVAIRGNLFEAYGIEAAVQVFVPGTCTFNDNRCIQSPPPNVDPRIVDLNAAAVIGNANYLERPTGGTPMVAFDVTVGNGPVALVGNISTGPIWVNGASLDPTSPWAPINVVV